MALLFLALTVETVVYGFRLFTREKTDQSVLTLSISGRGVVDPGEGVFTFAKDSLVILEARAEEGWVFSHWEGETADRNSPRTTLTMDSDHDVRAVFIEDLPSHYTLTLKVEGKGELFPSPGVHQIDLSEAKEPLTVVAEPASGYIFSAWMRDGIKVSTDPIYEFALEDNITLTAMFTPMFAINVESTKGGRATAPTSAVKGERVTVAAHPADNYGFVKWTENDQLVSTSPIYSFTAEKSRTLKAHFAPYYHVHLSATPGGSVETTHTRALEGTRVKVKAKAHPGYAFVGWTEAAGSRGGLNLGRLRLRLQSVDQAEYEFELDRNRSLKAVFAPVFPVEVAVSGNGTVNAPDKVIGGARYMLIAVPDEDHGFEKWTVGPSGNATIVSRSPVLFLNSKPDPTLTAHFLPTHEVRLSAEPPEGGSVQGEGRYILGKAITVKAQPAEKARFLGWYENGLMLSGEPEYQFTLTQTRHLTARFLPPVEVQLKAIPSAGGTLKGAGKHVHGEPATVVAQAEPGYQFSHWEKDGTVVSDKAAFTFTAEQDCLLEAIFNRVGTHEVSVAAVGAGEVRGGGIFTRGSQATVYAFSRSGSRFAYWLDGDGNIASYSKNYTFTVDDDYSLTAYFLPTCLVRLHSALVDGGGGEDVMPGAVSGGGNYAAGEKVVVTAEAFYGFRFDRWETAAGEFLTDQNVYEFVVAENTDLVARFVEAYPVTVNVRPISPEGEAVPGKPGRITGPGFVYDDASYAGKGLYDLGQTVTLTAQPFDHYVFVKWSENGRDLTDETGRLIGPNITLQVEGPRELYAHFRPGEYTVGASVLPAGAGIVLGTGGYLAGESARLTAIPKRGYQFENWTEDGHVYLDNPLPLNNLAGDRHLTANFNKIEGYNIDVVVEPAGAGRVAGGGMWYGGEEVRLIAINKRGYKFAGWLENNNLISTETTLLFPATGDRQLVALFEPLNAYTITVNVDPGGRVRGDGIYYEGEMVTLRAIPYEGFAFVNWSEADNSHPKSTYRFPATEDCELTAHFTDQLHTIAVRSNDSTLGTVSISHVDGTTKAAAEANIIAGKGAEITIHAHPIGNNTFTNWTIDGQIVSIDQNYTIIVEEDLELEATFSRGASCPFVYSYDGAHYYFEHEAIPFAVNKVLETTSFGTLRQLQNVEGAYHIRIAEELEEKSFVNGFQLVAVDYPADSGIMEVFADIHGKPHTIKEKTGPVSFTDAEGNDFTEIIVGGTGFVGSSPDDLRSGKYVDIYEAVFNRPPEASTEAKLMLVCKKTPLVTDGWEWVMETIDGINNLWWIEKLLETAPFKAKFKDFISTVYLGVELWDGNQWVRLGEIKAGMDLTEEFLVPLDLTLVDESVEQIKVRFVSGAGLFNIGRVTVDFSENEIVAVHELTPDSSMLNQSIDVHPVISEFNDEQRVRMSRGDCIDLIYTAPPLDQNLERGFTVALKGYYHMNSDGIENPTNISFNGSNTDPWSVISGVTKAIPGAVKIMPQVSRLYQLIDSVYLQPLEVKMEKIFVNNVLPWVDSKEP